MCVVFGHAAMAIVSIVTALTATEICGNVVCCTILAIGLVIFRHASLAICGIIVCCTTTAMRCIHNNHPKEGHAAKMPAT